MTDVSDKLLTVPVWNPRPRPAWVSSLNDTGRRFGAPEAVIPLDEASLLDAARAATGLSDFGDDAWREPFGILLHDLETEAELTLTGRLLVRVDIVHSLIARLKMAEVESQHPEILEQPVDAPIFITGMGRTGTTIMLELLGQDPHLRPALGWEFRYPSPPPEPHTPPDDPRLLNSATAIDLWHQVVPELQQIHETVIDEPDEDSMGQMHEFTSGIWSATQRVPNYEAWSAKNELRQALRFHRRLLQHLQWRKPGRWILKNPSYLFNLPSLFAEFPDARVIVTHRDPLKVLASNADMFATLRWQRSERVDYGELVRSLGTRLPRGWQMAIDQRESGAVPEDRFVDVRYADLMQDHIGTVAAVYEQLGMEFTNDAAARMRDHLDRKPKDRHGARKYRFEDLGLDRDAMRDAFATYMKRYDIPEEI